MLRVGRHPLKYERRSRRDVERTPGSGPRSPQCQQLRALSTACPAHNGTVRTEWLYLPSAQLGGDAFGYYWLDPDTFVFYLVDVAGHGVGSAMHSVAVLNVLRQRALPHVDFKNPAEVLSSLNARFQMDSHNGMYFTMWYGVYRTRDRTLAYGCAGHHPAYLVPLDRRTAQPLGLPALMIGAIPDNAYQVLQADVPAGSTVYLFSDGVFEIDTRNQRRWGLSDFVPLLVQLPLPGMPETERLYRSVRRTAIEGPLEDDCSLLVLTFL